VAFDDAARVVRDPHKGVAGKAVGVAAIAGRMAAYAVVTGALSEWLSGRGQEEDESFAGWMARKAGIAFTGFADQPLMGPAIDSLVLGKKVSVRQAPGVSVLEGSARFAHKLWDIAANDEDPDAKLAWDALEQVGFFKNLPVRQARKMGEGLADASADSPADVVDAVGGRIYGDRDRRPANPASDLADALR
jgi:hypothetical protein